MTAQFKVRRTGKDSFSNYLKKSRECFNAVDNSFNLKEWNASAINAIHSCISACDAMCVYYLGRRHTGENHNEAVKLFKLTQPTEREISSNAIRLSRILSVKNIAEYEGRLISMTEAEKILKDCKRFIEYVRKQLPRQ